MSESDLARRRDEATFCTLMPRPRARSLYPAVKGALARSLGTVLLANLSFFALLIAVQGDQEVIVARIRAAFETGDLGTSDYLDFDPRRGWHQYNDCNILQMVANRDSSRLERALAPKVFYTIDWDRQCAVLRDVIVEGVDQKTLHLDRYARYWHGYTVVAALGLKVMELRALRRALSAAVWLAIALLASVTWRSGPHVRGTALLIAVTAATVWAVPYFAPGFSHGPGEALLLFALTAIAARPKMTARLASVLPYAAAFGATIVFFEMLTAQLPVAVGWLAAMVLAARRDDDRPGEVGAATVTLLAIVVFSVAAAATVIIKQVLAVSVAEPGAAAVFLEHLNLYMGRSEARGNWAEMLRPFGSLLEQSSVLTFGNTLAARVLMAGAGLAWLAAAIRGWYQRHSEQGRDVLLLLGVALVPVAWTLLLPTHTGGHAPFMVRMFVMPISVAPLALFWPAVDAPTPGDGDAHAGRGVHR